MDKNSIATAGDIEEMGAKMTLLQGKIIEILDRMVPHAPDNILRKRDIMDQLGLKSDKSYNARLRDLSQQGLLFTDGQHGILQSDLDQYKQFLKTQNKTKA